MLPEKTKIIKWLTLWLITWGIVLLQLEHAEPPATQIPLTVLIVFPVSIGVALFLFPEERKLWFVKMNFAQTVTIIAGVLALCILRPGSFIGDSLFVVAHVFFQQIMVAFLIFLRPSVLKQILWRVLLFFGLSHVLLIFVMPVAWGLFFTLFSLPGGILFTLLIERVKNGIGLSCLLHFAFYIVLVQFL